MASTWESHTRVWQKEMSVVPICFFLWVMQNVGILFIMTFCSIFDFLKYCINICLFSSFLEVCCLVTKSCPTLCDPMDYSLPGSSVHRILQARILEWVAISFSRRLEWVAISFSRRSSGLRDWTRVSRIVGRRFTIRATREVLCYWKWNESEVAQSCPTPCDPMDCSLPGSSVHGVFQARILEWVAISFSRRSSRLRERCRRVFWREWH